MKMDNKEWYYVKNNKPIGPFSKSELEELFNKERLNSNTLVWSKTLNEWASACEVEELKNINFTQFPPSLPIEKQMQNNKQIRPWLRFWARIIDISIFTTIFYVLIVALFPKEIKNNDMSLFSINIAMLFLMIPTEAFLLSVSGTTPGKWLFGIKVVDLYGKKPVFSSAFHRGFSLFGNGLGLGLPLIYLFTMVNSYIKLKKQGITKWDQDNKLTVLHRDISPWIICLNVFFFICILFLITGQA